MRYILPLLALCLCMATPVTAQMVIFEDDFENGSGNWVLEGAWGLTTAQSNSPTNSLTDSPGGNYAASQNISATLADPLDFTTALDANLFFSAIYDIEDGNFDYLFIEVSTDGVTWLELDRIFGQGNLSPWIEYDYSLAGFAGEEEVFVRFRFFSDGGFEVDGAYIDDVRVEISDVDNGPPLVVHNGPEFYEGVAGDFVATAQIADISGIGSAVLSYDLDGASGGTVDGVDNGDGTFDFTIPAQPAGVQVDYSITVADASPNANAVTVDGFDYIAGTHVFYDNGVVDFVNSFGPAAQSGLTGAAVRFTLSNQNVVYALIRNYTDNMRPNSPMMFHIWDDAGGVPGNDVIEPFEVIPEANLIDNSPMTRIDLSAFTDELSALSGDFYAGYTVPEGETWLVQTTPTIAGRTYVFNGADWTLETDDYHFRLVTEFQPALTENDSCDVAYDLSGLLGGVNGATQNSPLFDNTTATTGAFDPTDGFDCFADTGGPALDNTQWFTFVGDGNIYEIRTDDCGAANPMPDNDSQIAVYSGDDCDNLTPVACNEDEGNPLFNGLVTLETEVGVTYYVLVDGWNGLVGEYCVTMTRIEETFCEDISAGTSVAEAQVICLNDTLRITNADVVIPNSVEGEAIGYAMVVSSADISGSTSPFTEQSFAGNFAVNPTGSYNIAFVNTLAQLPAGTYFFTSVAFAGGVYTDPPTNTLSLIDFTNGCAIAGQSIEVTLLDATAPLSASFATVNATDGNSDGSATVTASGGTGDYSYEWSNGDMDAMLDGVPSGTYTVTITDVNGCSDPIIEEVFIDFTSNVIDPTIDAAVKLFPNPATGLVNLSYDFGNAIDFNVSISNQLGQTVLTRNVSSATAGSLQFDVSELPAGMYAVRLADGNRFTVKPLIVK
ncbi:hypothetical protein CEQ90_08625 [Lewinellaceae bacterium SD302]|nr:hypothetical protein CEQ90_08625 [Lewinellaceae bacterium SD302]